MKTVAIETAATPDARGNILGDWAELVKARLTMLVLLTTAVGYYLGVETNLDLLGLWHAVFGTAMAAGGA